MLGKAYIFPPNFLRKILNGVLLVTQFSDYCLLNVFFHYIFKDIVSFVSSFIRYDYFFLSLWPGEDALILHENLFIFIKFPKNKASKPKILNLGTYVLQQLMPKMLEG